MTAQTYDIADVKPISNTPGAAVRAAPISAGPSAVPSSAPTHPRWAPACEALLGITLIFLAGSLGLPGGVGGLIDVQPSPLWVVVLAIAVRYGAPSGYLAGALSAGADVLLRWGQPSAQAMGPTEHQWIPALLMLVVGGAVGEIVDARERRVAGLEACLREAGRSLQALSEHCRAAQVAGADLEKQIAFQSSSTLTFSALGRRLQSLRLSDLHPAILDLTATALEADACSLFVCQPQGLRMVAAPRGSRHRAATAASPLVDLAIREARVVTVREFLLRSGGRVLPRETPLMVGPLMTSRRRVYGVVVVESMPVTKFTPAAVTRFDALLGWASAAIENALRHEGMARRRAAPSSVPADPIASDPHTNEPAEPGWERAPVGGRRL